MNTQLHDCQYINQPAFQATSMLVTDVGDKNDGDNFWMLLTKIVTNI